MRRVSLLLMLLLSGFFVQSVFAEDEMLSSESRPCISIAKACISAGYTRNDNNDKRFWFDCMKPILLGKTVKDVNVDAATAKSCRKDKIDALKKDLKDFQNANSH